VPEAQKLAHALLPANGPRAVLSVAQLDEPSVISVRAQSVHSGFSQFSQGSVSSVIHINRSEAKPDFNTESSILGLLHDRVRLDESFPMGPCSTSGDKKLAEI
jgi:hypothetical protein